MDAKLTLSFDEEIIAQAKKFAKEKGISVSRLTEYLFKSITTQPKIMLQLMISQLLILFGNCKNLLKNT